ncbi:hypothetical protein Lal_00022842 [Lupinus albus]|nr:hypothetical protein Lal_00022842 [Lupinus albus]
MSIINPQSKELSARLAKFVGRGITPTTYTNLSLMTDSGFMFPEFLKNQGLQVLVEMHGKMCPSLIREFYSNLQCKNGVYQTMVKNIFIILDEDLLVDVGGLGRFDHPYGYFEEKLLCDFEPVRAYRNMLRDSQRHQATSKPIVNALAVEYRLLYTSLVYCLAPRDLHHDDPTEVDLYLMFALKENVRIYWPHLILLNILGFSTSSSALGYPILISRIIEHALVDVSDTGYLITDPQENLILGQYIHFHMDIYKYEGLWTYFEDVDFYPESPELPPPANNSDEESIAPLVQYHALDEANNDEAEEDDEEVEEDPSENSDRD